SNVARIKVAAMADAHQVRIDIRTLADSYDVGSRYPGSLFQPVNIDAKLFHPWRTTMIRWPGMNARNPHIAAKCHTRARWNPPMIQAIHPRSGPSERPPGFFGGA